MSARADLKSAVITDLDASPKKEATAGEGRPGFLRMVDDFVAVAVAILDTTITSHNGSTLRMARFPTQAKVKKVEIATDAALDSNASQSLAFELGVGFSTAANDGTPAAYQGLFPSATLTGVAPVAANSASFNAMFGTITQSGSNLAIPRMDVTFGVLTQAKGVGAVIDDAAVTNVLTGGTYTLAASMAPMWEFFGYVDGRGNPQDPGGYFDIVWRASVVAATAHAANAYTRVEYVL